MHESYTIPWNEILEFKPTKRILYRDKVVDKNEYIRLRESRIKDLIQRGIDLNVAETAIPLEYSGISNSIFQQINEDIIYKMYQVADKLQKYKEYTIIVQVENDRIIVPEIILPERLRTKK